MQMKISRIFTIHPIDKTATFQLDDCGIDVVGKIETTLSREDAQTFYSQHQGTDFFLQLIDYMTRYIILQGILYYIIFCLGFNLL